MDVTIVQRPKQLMNPFDPDMASMIHNEMRKHGIKLVLGAVLNKVNNKKNSHVSGYYGNYYGSYYGQSDKA